MPAIVEDEARASHTLSGTSTFWDYRNVMYSLTNGTLLRSWLKRRERNTTHRTCSPAEAGA
ncbi:hypothetical protein IG193_00070 [Infirmifilum lucidum]|uniref:Uncharacterized protein n=1 Tax=Infirmifilum lucidum TaxID=2776706 RepID=A0A7L9FGH4_9CREN|nr:hypothetical protein [Infirmifilum lucidum]QOJ78900.1 hypothetical protein IG193_00070 [Infirmifilum lucidum]